MADALTDALNGTFIKGPIVPDNTRPIVPVQDPEVGRGNALGFWGGLLADISNFVSNAETGNLTPDQVSLQNQIDKAAVTHAGGNLSDLANLTRDEAAINKMNTRSLSDLFPSLPDLSGLLPNFSGLESELAYGVLAIVAVLIVLVLFNALSD